MGNQNDGWIPLTEYSVKYDISVSSLRRYIKEERIDYIKDRGKYLIADVPQNKKKRGRKPKTKLISQNLLNPLFDEEVVARNNAEVQKLREEVSELKMYVNVLEKKLGLD